MTEPCDSNPAHGPAVALVYANGGAAIPACERCLAALLADDGCALVVRQLETAA